MKKTILVSFSLLIFVVNAVCDERYFVDSIGDIDALGKGGWLYPEDTAFIAKNEIVKEPKVEKKPVEIKLEYKNSDTEECTSIKKGCGSSR